MIGLYRLKQHYDWPVELLKVKKGIRDLGKCLTHKYKGDGYHGNVEASWNGGEGRGKSKESVSDVETHNGGLGAGCLDGRVHTRWILKMETVMF